MKFIPVSFPVILFFVLVTLVPADAFQSEVIPDEIRSGDVFLIRITGAKTSRLPSGSFLGKKLIFSGCGEGCFIAIGASGIKTKPGTYTIRLKAAREKANLNISATQPDFPLMHLTLPKEKVFLSSANRKRANAEKNKLKTIFGKVSEKLWEDDFILPLENDISTVFGTRRVINHKKISVHTGLDFRGPEGEEIVASNQGKVVFAKEQFYGGNTVIIDHGQGIYTFYMHLSGFNITTGDVIAKGDVIGFVGSSGRSTGPHLHFGAKVRGIDVNPESLFNLEL
jgi:murein DD-endopeptidase MepM/ murein hydrolase activator NlpD